MLFLATSLLDGGMVEKLRTTEDDRKFRLTGVWRCLRVAIAAMRREDILVVGCLRLQALVVWNE